VYSVDFSNAVEANQKNNGANPRLKLAQASIYELPFAPQQFDVVICLGVLQHTPDVQHSVQCLCNMVKPGGLLAIDFYPINGWHTKLQAKYLLRPFTKNMRHDKLLSLIERNANWLINAYSFFDTIGIGRYINRFLPICDIKNTLPPNLAPAQLREWVILDTFDMFSPAYDQPQRIPTMAGYVQESGLAVTHAGYVEYLKSLKAAVVRGKRNS
jgi:SAM-dependent methyltransferase